MRLVNLSLLTFGVLCLTVAGWLVTPALGLAVLGAACVVAGFPLGEDMRRGGRS